MNCIECGKPTFMSASGKYSSLCPECKHNFIPITKLKTLSRRKREALGMPVGYIPQSFGGRDRFREIIRMRDNHTCQLCFKKWEKGKRRFDVHHQDPEMEGRSAERGICKIDKENYDKMITLCHKCHLNLPHIWKR